MRLAAVLRRILVGLVLLGIALLVLLAGHAWLLPSRQVKVPATKLATVDANAAAGRLAAAVRFRTVSSETDAELNRAQFEQFQAFLVKSFPHLHATLKREMVGGLSMLYTWPGSDPSAPPIALMAHQDVVPIAEGTEGRWAVPPFAGEIRDGFVWGRGAWDDKGNLMSMMEAIEMLVSSGFQPRQTVYLISGADEEVGGARGARAVAALLRSRGVKLDFILDEGLLVTEGVLPGLSQPAALVGVAEKGYASFQLSVDAVPGHSSMPPARTAIGAMSTALSRLESHQMPTAIRGVSRDMFDTLAPEMGGVPRLLLGNLWLFEPVVRGQLEKSPSSMAMLRTTTALTMMNAGNKDNVLPGRAQAVVNFRLLPGDTVQAVRQHVQDVMGNEAIHIEPLWTNDASPVTASDGSGYTAIARTVREVFPGVVVAPGLMLGATDSRHLLDLSQQVLRFSPVRAHPQDLTRFHGTDERISVDNYVEAIQFYHQLLHNVAQQPAPRS